ncbi:EAL domain-containing protein, partial [Sulfurimonas sp.]|uniref:bifunctional diguanylate cyclase/phosphodiesterase n=1 Tax=Sulfurimonas sp. TaxID=2022749 RepID=UPI0025D80DFA
VNDEFCNISGYDFSELVGKSHNLIRHPENHPSLFKDLWKTIKSQKIWKGIIRNRKKDGTDYYVNSTIVPIRDNNNIVKEYMSIRSDVTDLINKEKLILKQTTDIRTGLPNRIKLIEVIELNKDDIKLAIVQINAVQSINDFYGTQYGEKLIIEVAKSLKELIHIKKIQLFKVSSDEFAFLYQGPTSLRDFIDMCKSVETYFDHNSFKIDNDNFDVTITIGIAKGQKNIYVNAEKALHHAHETNQDIVCYDLNTEIMNNFDQNRKWVTKIKKAIQDDRIVVYAQPIVSLCNTREKKYECLVRMIDDDGSVISPYYFLEIAKKSRLYSTFTKIVIEKSFRHFSSNNASFSINLTIQDIINEDILNYIREKIREYDIANQLVFEIVESEGIENFDEVTNFIQEMKSYGCRISIDDFGTGYSNFAYLMKLDADYIKIDGSLIINIDKDESSQLVVELIIDFAKKLNRKTIAEYVHNEAVLKKVKEMKIDYSQGYYTGEPSPL